MPNQSSLRAMTQIRKGVTTPRKQGNRPLVESVCSPLLLYFFFSSFFFPFLFFFSPFSLLFLSFLFFFSLFSFFFFLFLFFFCFRLQMATRSLNFDSYLCAHGRWKPGRCPCKAGYQPRPVNEARATFSIPSSVLGFYLRYVCLSVYSGPYANYTKGLSHPPSAFPENTHVHARNARVSRVSAVWITLRGLPNGKKIYDKIDFSAGWRLEYGGYVFGKMWKKEEEKTREVMRLDNGIRRIFKVKVSDRNLNVERERESYFSSYF